MGRQPGTTRRAVLLGGAAVTAAAAGLAGCDSGTGSRAPSAPPGSRTSAPPSRRPVPAGPAGYGALARSLDGPLVRPGSAGYDTARLLFNPRFDSVRPAAIAYCTRPEDVRECLLFARRTGTRFAVRSGGHSYAGWSTGTGLVIDVSRISAISVSGRTATIGAGAKLISVYDRLAAHGVTVPAGSCPTVGISGLALGGGHGVVSRAYGLTCDSLTGAEIVLADGRTEQVSAARHGDLFWALRGAGNGNFGIVTRLHFTTHPAVDGVTFRLTWPWERAATVTRAWQRWAAGAPDRLWTHLVLECDTGGSPSVSAGGLYLGPRGELGNHLDRLGQSAGTPVSSQAQSRSYLGAMLYMAGCPEPAQCLEQRAGPYTARSHFYRRPLTGAGIAALTAGIARVARLAPGGKGSVQLSAMGGAVNRVKPHQTAFVHRDSFVLAQYIAEWQEGTAAPAVTGYTRWLDGYHRAMGRHVGNEAYQNYTDPTLADWRTAYYGANLGRLEKVKAAYDPDRLFRVPQGV